MYKGPDFATTRLRRLGTHAETQVHAHALGEQRRPQQPRDEVKEYVDSRYISANEAVWRTFEFLTHGRDVPVTALQIHLEGEHSITVNTTVALADQLARTEKDTTLTAFFKYNAANPSEIVNYQDFPWDHVYRKPSRTWAFRSERAKRAVGELRGLTFHPVSSTTSAYFL